MRKPSAESDRIFGSVFWDEWTDVRDNPEKHPVLGMGFGASSQAMRWAAMGRFMDSELGRAAMFTAWMGETHTKRGVSTLNAARAGSAGRRGALADDTRQRLDEMERLLTEKPDKGVSWAAETAFKKGIGNSTVANRALWYRHMNRKLSHTPPL